MEKSIRKEQEEIKIIEEKMEKEQIQKQIIQFQEKRAKSVETVRKKKYKKRVYKKFSVLKHLPKPKVVAENSIYMTDTRLGAIVERKSRK